MNRGRLCRRVMTSMLAAGATILAATTPVTAPHRALGPTSATGTTVPPAPPLAALSPTAAPRASAVPAPPPTPFLPVSPAPTAAPSCQPAIATAPPPATSRPGRIESFSLGEHALLAYVPGAYAARSDAQFPVVYFLHGSPGSAADWVSPASNLPDILDGMIAQHRLPPLIAVFPDEQGVTADDSWWGDDAIGDTVETWFVATLVPSVDARYRTLGAARRGIAGISAGGFGAVNISLRHPGMFSWVASYSGVFSAPEDIFGSGAADNSPQLTAASLPAAERTPLFVGGGTDDTDFLPDTQRFIATIDGLGWTQLDTEIVPGPHGWEAWQTEVRDSLTWLGQIWSADMVSVPTPTPSAMGGCHT